MNINAAIFFSFLSIFTWVNIPYSIFSIEKTTFILVFCLQGFSGFFSYQRHQAGFEAAFGGGVDEQQAGYQAYQQTGYSDPPFTQQGNNSTLDCCPVPTQIPEQHR
jgi:hypothetical protein